MSLVDLIMPKLGESIVEATILKWHKKAGDSVEVDETVLDIATDKVDSEVPSTASGVIAEVLYNENDVVAVGEVIARIETTGEMPSGQQSEFVNRKEEKRQEERTDSEEHEDAEVVEEVPYQPGDRRESSGDGIRFYSPLVLNIAAREGISMNELEGIKGTGQDGRVSKKDILNYVEEKKAHHRKKQAEPAQKQEVQRRQEDQKPLPARREREMPAREESNYGENVEIIEMDRMRKMIAQHMVHSKNVSAHVTSFAECDVTNLVIWRNKIKKDFEKREGDKITFTPLFIEAVVKALKKYPYLNSSLDGDKIILKKDINIGMATAMNNGNLIVPVIRNADQLNLTGLAKRVNGLANAARENKLRPDDTQGGTFTLTNVGTFGSIMGTPIINQPQIAILAVGAIKKRAVVVETPQGDSIAIRHMMYLSLSYDHRIVDGALGSTFLNAVAKELENFDVNRSY